MAKIKNKNIILVAVILVIAFTVVLVNTKLQKGTFKFFKPKVFRPSINIPIIDLSPRLPDLVIESIDAVSTITDSRVHTTITVKNQGNGSVSNSDAPLITGSLRTNDRSMAPSVEVFTRSIWALDPGETQTIYVSFDKDRRRNLLTVIVDSQLSVRESTEENNIDWEIVPTGESDEEAYGTRG